MDSMSEVDPISPVKVLNPTNANYTNTERVENARSKIQRAMAELRKSGSLPMGVEARLIALRKRIGGSQSTYYKYRELWHPVDLAETSSQKAGSEREEESAFDRLEDSVVKEENPLDIVVNNCIQERFTVPLYEVMTRWQIDENQSKSSTLIPQFRPQITPPSSPSLPKGRPRIDQRLPMPWPKWGIVTNSPRLTPISPNPADQTPQNPVCYTLPMPIAIKPCSDRFQESEAVAPRLLLFAVPVMLPVVLVQLRLMTCRPSKL